MKNVKFSVIIPAYNSEAYIKQAIDSVLNQSYKCLELILVNDGSIDSTLEIIDSYAKTDNRIKVINKFNGGYVTAINAGLDSVSGDYFLFLGSDDYLDNKLFESIDALLADKHPDLIVFKTLKVFGSKKELDQYSNFEDLRFIDDKNFFSKICDENNGVGLLSHRDTSKIYKRSVLGDLRLIGKSGVASDDFFAMSFSRCSSTFLFCPIVGYYWTIRSDSVSGKKRSNQLFLESIKVCYSYYNKLSKKAELNCVEIEYLSFFYYKLILLARSFRFSFKNFFFIKKFFFHLNPRLNKYKKVKIRHRLALLFPIAYSFVNLMKRKSI